MTEKTIKTFINEIFSKSPKQNYPTNKTDVYQIVDIWSFDRLDLKDYGPENKRGCRYILKVIDYFSKLGWTHRLTTKNSQTTNDSFKKILKSSKRKPSFIETDRQKDVFK